MNADNSISSCAKVSNTSNLRDPMRKERVIPKNREIVVLPENLVSFLKDVNEMIESHDELATIASDDLMQCEYACGGLVEEGGNSYSFTYFPEEDIRDKWYLMLNASDIQMIARDEKDTIVMWACSDPSCHSKSMDPNERCFYCDYVEE